VVTAAHNDVKARDALTLALSSGWPKIADLM
jgi:hypothetical protein